MIGLVVCKQDTIALRKALEEAQSLLRLLPSGRQSSAESMCARAEVGPHSHGCSWEV